MSTDSHSPGHLPKESEKPAPVATTQTQETVSLETNSLPSGKRSEKGQSAEPIVEKKPKIVHESDVYGVKELKNTTNTSVASSFFASNPVSSDAFIDDSGFLGNEDESDSSDDDSPKPISSLFSGRPASLFEPTVSWSFDKKPEGMLSGALGETLQKKGTGVSLFTPLPNSRPVSLFGSGSGLFNVGSSIPLKTNENNPTKKPEPVSLFPLKDQHSDSVKSSKSSQ